MKRLIQGVAALAFAMPFALGAQAANDPDKKVMDGGVKVEGWRARLDKPTAKVEDLKFVSMGPGFHVTGGPAAIYWNAANAAKGNYTVKASLTQTKATPHREAYGIFLGGDNLTEPSQSYLYLVIGGTGEYTIKHRAGSEVHTIVEWTASPALKKVDEAGKATNELAIEVGDDVRYMLNGVEVLKTPRAQVMGSLDGATGLRVNHNLDIHVGSFSVTKK